MLWYSSIPERILAISLCNTSMNYKEPINFNVITDTLLGTDIREDEARKRGVNTKAVCYPMRIHEPVEKYRFLRLMCLEMAMSVWSWSKK